MFGAFGDREHKQRNGLPLVDGVLRITGAETPIVRSKVMSMTPPWSV